MFSYSLKPFDQMTLPELRSAHARMVACTRRGAWAQDIEEMHVTRDVLATWVGRREREAEQEVAA